MSERKPIQPRPMGGPGRGPHGRGPGAKPKNVRASIKRLMGYMGAYKWFLLLVVVLIAASSLAQVMGTSYLRSIVDEYITPMAQQVATEGAYAADLMSGFVRTLISMAFVYLFGALSTFIYARLMLRISTGTLLKLRTDLFNHMETLSIKYFDTHAHGDIMSRMTNDIENISTTVSQSLPSLCSGVLTILGTVAIMLFYC